MTDQTCNNCGGTEFTKFLEQEVSEDKTKEKYSCDECGKEGRIFRGGTATIYSGAFRR